MAAETMNAPVRRERKSFAQRIRGFWRRVEPGITLHEAFIERWDGCGEGPASALAFEGFGLSFAIFVGGTPRFTPDTKDPHDRDMTRWYAGKGR